MEMARALPWLIFAVTLQLVASIKSSMASGMAKPECQETCGNLTIPYPFGIGPGCYREGFDVSCEDNHAFRHNSTSTLKIYDIDLPGGQARVSTIIATTCFNYSYGYAWVNTGYLFSISNEANLFTVLGCNTLAYQSITGDEGQRAGAWCSSGCADKQSVEPSGKCTSNGCCQTSIAPRLTFSNITFDDRFNNSAVSDFNPCSYAFIAEKDWFKFDPSYLEGDRNFTNKYKHEVPTVMDWVVGYETCDEAKKNASSYACISKNGDCSDSPNATGYICTCNHGYEGNPYLEEGCKGHLLFADIDECLYPNKYLCHGICSNTVGNYGCVCPSGKISKDAKVYPCERIPYVNSNGVKPTKMIAGNLPIPQILEYISRNIMDKSD